MDDLISGQAAIDIERNATVDTNPSHFEAHQKFTQFMDDAEISSFGRWQWSNGFNTALTAVGIDLKKLPSAQPEPQEGTWVYGEDSTADCVDGYRCSQCGFFVPWDYNHKLIDYINDYAYCPNCGAKMKGENRMSGNYNDAENYCKDCDRSIYGKYPSCDTNIENNGIYTKPGSPCYCKCREGVGMVEKYPWEKRTNG